MKITYDPAELPHMYFSALQHASIIPVQPKEKINDRKLTWQSLKDFDKHVELHSIVDELKLKTHPEKTGITSKQTPIEV